MKSKIFGIFLLLSPSLGASPSLFFTKNEIELIHSVNKDIEETSETLHLSAIVYATQDHWSLWLNNRLIRPHQPLPIKGFQIESVTPYKVNFSWLPPIPFLPRTFTLRPNQIFLVNERRIIQN